MKIGNQENDQIRNQEQFYSLIPSCSYRKQQEYNMYKTEDRKF